MQKDSVILFECGRYWVSTDSRGDYCVWEQGVTHSVKRDTIGHSLPGAFARAIDKAKARNEKDNSK